MILSTKWTSCSLNFTQWTAFRNTLAKRRSNRVTGSLFCRWFRRFASWKGKRSRLSSWNFPFHQTSCRTITLPKVWTWNKWLTFALRKTYLSHLKRRNSLMCAKRNKSSLSSKTCSTRALKHLGLPISKLVSVLCLTTKISSRHQSTW